MEVKRTKPLAPPTLRLPGGGRDGSQAEVPQGAVQARHHAGGLAGGGAAVGPLSGCEVGPNFLIFPDRTKRGWSIFFFRTPYSAPSHTGKQPAPDPAEQSTQFGAAILYFDSFRSPRFWALVIFFHAAFRGNPARAASL